jgi:hypothetical protein
MERPMKKSKLPRTDSIQKLAEFWDTHDLTDFEDELETVSEPVFVRAKPTAAISVPLAAREAKAIGRLAQSKGLSPEDLIRTWVIQNIRATQKSSRANSGRKRPSAA